MTSLPTVSVLLVTKNGARYLAEVLTSVYRQQGEFSLGEIVAVDSGSRDATLDILQRFGVQIVRIPPHEFGHGKTRNLAASRAQGEYLVFLTQDATPANEYWLARLLAPLQRDVAVAGAYSRHLPRPHCHPMEWRRIVECELSGRAASQLNSAVDNPAYATNPALYYFFSNVSSVLRRQVWERFPFPEVEFGEDQLWAKQVLEAGYKTAYCADSLVYHSHGYGPWSNFCRHFDHFLALPGGTDRGPQLTLRQGIPAALRAARADLAFWARHRGEGKASVVLRWALPALSWHLAANLGVWLGERAQRLPRWLCRRLSLQERIKRR
ncbi:MAG: glycosyltransferase family 2 protein [Candidatus Binatia bacterium]|nr:glycosyltransferase family 2 protein [Candidatus Binatia bacterium]